MSKFESILIAEDDPNDIFALKRLFQKQRVLNPLQFVNSGEDALAYLSGAGVFSDRTLYPYPVLLLVDLKMKGISGWDVLEWLKKQPTQPAEVAVLSGIDIAEVSRAYQLGSHHFLFKPLNFQEFVNMIRTLDGLAMKEAPSGCYLETKEARAGRLTV